MREFIKNVLENMFAEDVDLDEFSDVVEVKEDGVVFITFEAEKRFVPKIAFGSNWWLARLILREEVKINKLVNLVSKITGVEVELFDEVIIEDDWLLFKWLDEIVARIPVDSFEDKAEELRRLVDEISSN